jgi:hypothetical protein
MNVMYVCTLNLFRRTDYTSNRFQTEVVMQNNRNRATRLAASLRELANLGSSVDLSAADTEDDAAPDIEIEQAGGILESSIFELSGGLTGYMVYLVVTNQTSQTIYCRDVELRVPWEDSLFQWMQDPREARGSEAYRFSGRGSPEFPRDQVVNHVLLKVGALAPRRPLEGWLLATGRPMPDSLRDRQQLDASLAIFASNHVEYTTTIRLWTERLAVKPRSRRGASPTCLKDLSNSGDLSNRIRTAFS